MTLYDLSPELLGLVRVWSFMMCACTIYVLIRFCIQKQKTSKIVAVSVLLPAEYVFFHLQLDIRIITDTQDKLVFAPLARGNIYIIILLLVILTGVSGYLMHYCRVWEQSHLTDIAIKESLDNLPVGICYCRADGKVVLINNKMHEFLTEVRLLNGTDPVKNYDTLNTSGDTDPVFKLKDGQVFILRKNIINTENGSFTEYLALDVTPKYVLTEKLAEENERLRAKGEELRKQGRTIDEVIINREILDTKIKIHNKFGQLLLSSKYILTHDTDVKTKNELISKWKQVTLLRADENEDERSSSLADINRAAKAIGVNIIYRDALPEYLSEQNINILEHMLHEALTNSFSHAHADSLYVSFNEKDGYYEVNITNNGKKPEANITEGGGLSSLRRLIENHGGRMKTEAFPEFILKAELKK